MNEYISLAGHQMDLVSEYYLQIRESNPITDNEYVKIVSGLIDAIELKVSKFATITVNGSNGLDADINISTASDPGYEFIIVVSPEFRLINRAGEVISEYLASLGHDFVVWLDCGVECGIDAFGNSFYCPEGEPKEIMSVIGFPVVADNAVKSMALESRYRILLESMKESAG